MQTQTSICVRVRYSECDPLNLAHHSVYPVWFEMARTELLREQGMAYSRLEKEGVFFVVAKLSTRYRRPAYYDDQLTVHVRAEKTAGVKIEHTYEVHRDQTLIASGESLLACVDREGRLTPIPDYLLPG